jgi:hypothetical protein
MRTTINIDPEVLSAAKKLAVARSSSVGEVISELARRGLDARSKIGSRHGFPVFEVPCCASILLRARDDQDGRSVVAAGRACN